MSIWMTVASGLMSAPCRVVQWLTDAPATITRSAWGSSSAANGEAEPAGDAERVGQPGEQPVRRRRGGEDRADPLAERLELGPGVGEDGAAAGDDRGSLRAGDVLGDLHHRPHRRLGGGEIGRGGLPRLGACGRLGLDVDRQHQHDRPALGDRPVIRALRVVGGGLGAEHAVGDRPHRLDEVVLVDPEVARERGRRRLAGEDEQRRPALRGLGEPGHRVRQPGALVHADDTDAAGGARVSVGHAHGAALVAGVMEVSAAPAQRVGDDEVAAAEHAERVLHPLRCDRQPDDVGNGRRRHTGATASLELPSGWTHDAAMLLRSPLRCLAS